MNITVAALLELWGEIYVDGKGVVVLRIVVHRKNHSSKGFLEECRKRWGGSVKDTASPRNTASWFVDGENLMHVLKSIKPFCVAWCEVVDGVLSQEADLSRTITAVRGSAFAAIEYDSLFQHDAAYTACWYAGVASDTGYRCTGSNACMLTCLQQRHIKRSNSSGIGGALKARSHGKARVAMFKCHNRWKVVVTGFNPTLLIPKDGLVAFLDRVIQGCVIPSHQTGMRSQKII